MENTNVNQDTENLQDSERVARWNKRTNEELFELLIKKCWKVGEMRTLAPGNPMARSDINRDCGEIKEVLLQRLQVSHATLTK